MARSIRKIVAPYSNSRHDASDTRLGSAGIKYLPIKEKENLEAIIDDVGNFQYDPDLDRQIEIVALSKPADNSFHSRNNHSPQTEAFRHAIANAQSFIRIHHVNLNVPEVIGGLINAVKRGVRVEVLLPDYENEEAGAIDAKTNLQAFAKIEEACFLDHFETAIPFSHQNPQQHKAPADNDGGT